MTPLKKQLAEVLMDVERYLVERGIEHRGVTGRTIILPKVREALAEYNRQLSHPGAQY